MTPFDFIRPTTLPEALDAWRPGAAWLAGGTNLVDLMKTGAARPDRVIDLSRIPDLGRIETLEDGGTRIGAQVTNAALADDDGFARRYPMVAEALLSGASGQIRNAATVAGNLMQRPRCPYFEDPLAACNRRAAGSGCDARGGTGLNPAILGWSEACIATNPSDFAVPLVALDAAVRIEGQQGSRMVPLSEFLRLPGDTPERETELDPGEIIVALHLPDDAARFAGHARYLKVRDRTSFAFATVSAAAAMDLRDGRIAEARLALGAVAARPWRVAEAEAMLSGQTPDPELFSRAADIALDGAAPPDGKTGWKIELARRTAARALSLAAAGTPARLPALPASPFADTAGDFTHV